MFLMKGCEVTISQTRTFGMSRSLVVVVDPTKPSAAPVQELGCGPPRQAEVNAM